MTRTTKKTSAKPRVKRAPAKKSSRAKAKPALRVKRAAVKNPPKKKKAKPTKLAQKVRAKAATKKAPASPKPKSRRRPHAVPPSRTPDPALTPQEALLHELSYLFYCAPSNSRRENAQMISELYQKYKLGSIDAALDVRGRTLLHLAAERYSRAVLECLFYEFRARQDIVDNDGNTALHLLFSRSIDAEPLPNPCSRLIPYQQEKTFLAMQNHAKETALHRAARMGFPRAVKRLVTDGAPLTANADGLSPLSYAVLGGRLSNVTFLLSAGAVATKEDLALAKENKKYQIAKLLEGALGAKVAVKKDGSAQALVFAALQELHPKWKAPKKELSAEEVYKALLQFAAEFGARIGYEEALGGHPGALARDMGNVDAAVEEIADSDWFGDTQKKVEAAVKKLPEEQMKKMAPTKPKAQTPLTRIVNEMGSSFREAAEKAMTAPEWRGMYEDDE